MMTQCITAAVLFGAGDVLAQQAVEGKGRKHDVSKFQLGVMCGSLPCCVFFLVWTICVVG
jgi:hypothetical protein